MRFLVDECAGPSVARWLRAQGHDVASIYDETPGIADEQVLHRAVAEARILVTIDKDFGEHIFLHRTPHFGVVLLRLADERSAVKIEVLDRLLHQHAAALPGRFVVVTEQQVRFARLPAAG